MVVYDVGRAVNPACGGASWVGGVPGKALEGRSSKSSGMI